ncbi:MAG TPA: hypothetical protein VKY82_04940 [Flavobacterium sp.]|nr:hypothetical protein [Flavobacterium sp.]
MKGIITLAIFALGLSGFAQQRQLVKQQDHRQDYRNITTNNRYGNFDFSRLGLTLRQERLLVDLLKDKQNEEWSILRKYKNPQSRLIQLDRTYDRKIQNLLSRSQYDKWTKIYAYQYNAYNNKRWV